MATDWLTGYVDAVRDARTLMDELETLRSEALAGGDVDYAEELSVVLGRLRLEVGDALDWREDDELVCGSCRRHPSPRENAAEEWRVGVVDVTSSTFCPSCWTREQSSDEKEC